MKERRNTIILSNMKYERKLKTEEQSEAKDASYPGKDD